MPKFLPRNIPVRRTSSYSSSSSSSTQSSTSTSRSSSSSTTEKDVQSDTETESSSSSSFSFRWLLLDDKRKILKKNEMNHYYILKSNDSTNISSGLSFTSSMLESSDHSSESGSSDYSGTISLLSLENSSKFQSSS